ncbi:MAG: epimerase [Pseudomonadota bacterium]
MANRVLILGASGRFGRNAAQAFADAGWAVTRFDRRRGQLDRAAQGMDVIVNGWNPAYPSWEKDVPRLTEAVISAAESAGATVIIPGNIYVFGETLPPRLSEATPHRASHLLGRVRREMEEAYRASSAQTIVLRAGDFLDTRPSGNWFDKVMAARLGQGRFVYPGALDRVHSWAWLPDMARASVGLADRRDRLERFEDVPFDGFTLTGQDLGEAVGTAMGQPIETTSMSWLPLRLLAPVWPMGRHLVEMRYLWNRPHRLDGEKLRRLLPEFRPAPLETALPIALRGLDIHPNKPVPGATAPLSAAE